MKKLMCILCLLTSCSIIKGSGTATLDSVSVSVDGVDHKVPLDKEQEVEVKTIAGACLTPDLKHAQLLLVGKECEAGWIAVRGTKLQ